ncbi:MAG: hypothetical protein F6K36_07970 [Symploca sp. SIO3C6]|nr:hypothetical protein [Symploca sp. SIO3C6]
MNRVPCSAKSETPLLYRAVFEVIKGKFCLSEEDYKEGIVKLFEEVDCQAGKITSKSFKISAKVSKQLEGLSISSLIFEKIFLNQQALTQFYKQPQDFTDFEDEATQIIEQFFYQHSSIRTKTKPSKSLAEAAVEIQQLLEQLSKTNPTTTTAEKRAVVTQAAEQIESNPTFKARVINALKSGGIEAFKEAIDHPLVNIFVATIEGWKDAE